MTSRHEDELGMTPRKSRPFISSGSGPGNRPDGRNAHQPEAGSPESPSFPDQAHHAGVGSAINHQGIDLLERWHEPIAKEGKQALPVLRRESVCTADEYDRGSRRRITERPKCIRQLAAIAHPYQSGHISNPEANLFEMASAI